MGRRHGKQVYTVITVYYPVVGDLSDERGTIFQTSVTNLLFEIDTLRPVTDDPQANPGSPLFQSQKYHFEVDDSFNRSNIGRRYGAGMFVNRQTLGRIDCMILTQDTPSFLR